MQTRKELQELNALVADYDVLQDHIEKISNDLHGITIQGRYYDELKPIVKRELIDHFKIKQNVLAERIREFGFQVK